MSSAESTRAAVERYLDALNHHDPDAIAAAVAEDFVNEHTSARGTSRRGRDAYRAALPVFLDRFRSLHYDVEDLLVDGDRAGVAYRMTARYRDDTGVAHPITIRGMFRFRVVDGLIARRVDYWDGNDFERQITI
jgi:steroid delta-isomerase-like uncharacterized protein